MSERSPWNRFVRFLLLLELNCLIWKERQQVVVHGAITNPSSRSAFGTKPTIGLRTWRLLHTRGGGFFDSGNSKSIPSTKDVTVEDYVAAVEEKDAQHRNGTVKLDKNGKELNNESSRPGEIDEVDPNVSKDANADQSNPQKENAKNPDPSLPQDENANNSDPASGVGVKSHESKKSNAVGDPDGDDDDDDDDDDSEQSDMSTTEWEDDFDEELEELSVDPSETQLQVEFELVEGENLEDNDQLDETTTSASGGGVGVRLGQRLNHRRKAKSTKESRSPTTPTTKTGGLKNQHFLDAWLPHIFFPPSPSATKYLVDKSKSIDASSKIRLDRRTLYAALLLEWLHQGTSYRKILDPNTSQSLQASLSLASQPRWRQAFPRPNAIKLYDDDADKGCTLAMQETTAMALAHSLGAGMVILDDETIRSVRQELSRLGYSHEDLKPAALLKCFLDLVRSGKLNYNTGNRAFISSCMQRDLALGLDDPFDELATSSYSEMKAWEEEWYKGIPNKDRSESDSINDDNEKEKPFPLVLFLRTQAANSILKSKSAVEAIMQECTSNESTNLVVFGKGIDITTVSLPREPIRENPPDSKDNNSRHLPGGAPWFGFSPQNQNASGQNDPEGSRRFNIFLARTIDGNGNPGILGAVAPPQAGNLFPHMMAMQARERLQHQDDDSAVKAELERWANLLQHQMQSNEGNPMPPPQFFNASLDTAFLQNPDPLMHPNAPPPPPEVIQQTLQKALSELLDRLAEVNDDDTGESPSELAPDLHKAFAQILRHDNLRQGIADNLARAAPALSDPKCQGVMLSVYVPPLPNHINRGKLPGQPSGKPENNMGGWFQRILNNQDNALNNQDNAEDELDESRRKNMRQKRVRTMAAAAAVMAAKNAEDAKTNSRDSEKQENKAERNLARLESLGRAITVKTPADPVRAKSWEGWIARERGAVIFRQNRRSLNRELENRNLSLQQHTGTRGAGSALRQMLSVRDISDNMEDVIKCAVEIEASKGQKLHESPEEIHEKEMNLDVDVTLSQLMISEDGHVTSSEEEVISANSGVQLSKSQLKYLHPSSIETALSLTCLISPSPSGGLTYSKAPASRRSKEEILALAQDKHERALVSQVVSPQDIGVTYDMIGGLVNVKELLRQSITYPLKFPHLYSEGIAREAVKGVLLFGPPGTGKTMLAKAVATEGGASFLSVDASSVENKWLGESEKNAKAVFTLARRLAPCVIFIDEVDSLLSSREGTSDDSAHGTLTSVKTTMMSEWDGLNSGTNGSGEAGSDRVVVIGSTNRPFDLDEAVLRRFPRRILVDLPDLETRTEILEVTLAENRLGPDVNLTKIAERLEGYTGSDIKEVCREAVVQISHEQAKLLDQGFVSNSREDLTQGTLQRLRPVNMDDFEKALGKLKRSVSEKGKELARVWEWNDEYGEIKKEKKNHLPHLMNMYL